MKAYLRHTALVLTCIYSLTDLSFALTNPYETLGIDRQSTITEIKQAYKNLVRVWHPDKNKNSRAESKFIEINKAYELLTDPERKEQFDLYGKTEDTPNFRDKPDYSQFRKYEFDPFDSFFNQGAYRFQFNFNQGSIYHKNTITHKAYTNHIVPETSKKAYLVLFYGDLCFPCLHAEPVWHRIMQEVEPLGIGFATVHAQKEQKLAQKIGVGSLPYLIGVLDSQVVHYHESQLSLVQVVDFCRRLFPYKSVLTIDDSSAADFLAGWTDNRVRALLFGKTETIRLRYLAVAFRFRARIAFGHVGPKVTGLRQRYGVASKLESLLVFSENTSAPMASLGMGTLALQTMCDVLEANKFLMLPRLSSQQLFDELCPPGQDHLCVVLVTHNVPDHDSHRQALRNFIHEGTFTKERIRFMFVYEEKQEEFVKALSSGDGSPTDPLLHVVILWRKEHDRVRYQWLDSPWTADLKQANESRLELEETLDHLVESTEALPYDAKVATLLDEHARGLLTRIVNRLVLMGDVLRDNITRQEILPAVSVLLSVGFIVLVSYLMTYLVKLEEQSIQEKYRKEGKTPPFSSKNKPEHKLSIHEMRGETYNGLVRLLKPGCRTVVLLLDAESKPKLLPKFYRTVYPYRRNKTLMFAFLMVEKNLEWYRRLLLKTLGEARELKINPKNCIGTVLSLNGHRKYFCVYHAKHEETRLVHKMGAKESGAANGQFMGFEDSESEVSDLEAGSLMREENVEEYGNILFQEHLLDGLPNWLDRLFEGSTQRYYIQYWPENMK